MKTVQIKDITVGGGKGLLSLLDLVLLKIMTVHWLLANEQKKFVNA